MATMTPIGIEVEEPQSSSRQQLPANDPRYQPLLTLFQSTKSQNQHIELVDDQTGDKQKFWVVLG